jgi:hypothetical protein
MAVSFLFGRRSPLNPQPNPPASAAAWTYIFREVDTPRPSNGFVPFLDAVTSGLPFILAMDGASRYLIETMYSYRVLANGADFRTRNTFPAGATKRYNNNVYRLAGAISVQASDVVADPYNVTYTGNTIGNPIIVEQSWQIETAGAGNFSLLWSTDSAGANQDGILLRGSYWRYRKI